eukprot:TRINITY_DN726_c0_g1_i2.p1 TRINITY_DN726_c0_g1~~TRINITY_DN726_c0_g1_i2.p1  ORF type:complete len:350 (-),score=51.17 TRINITY_DN726_c0_g1_i2:92-1141(-)
MGNSCVVEKSQESADIDNDIKEKKKEDRFNLKVLILGTTASGKSTLAKQMKIIHNDGFTPEEKKNFKNILVLNLFLALKELVIQAEKFQYKISRKNKKTAKFFADINPYSEMILTPDLAERIKRLWEDSGIVKTFERYDEFDLLPNTEYCIQNIERFSSSTFEPTNEDVLHARQRTTGIVETCFKVEKYLWTIVDVGGQRTERRKWIHCFDSVNAVIYVAALDEYNLVNPEDHSTTRMEESLKVFSSIVHSNTFQKTCILLFLNKRDVFAEKMKKGDLNKFYPEYTGGPSYENGVAFIKEKYLSLMPNPTVRANTVVHETCAIDTKQISVIFAAVMSHIFRQRLTVSGL